MRPLLLLLSLACCSPAWAELDKDVAARAEALGLRVVAGRHLTLITDLPSQRSVDELPEVFDAAVPLWAEYFQRPVADGWHMIGSLMRDPAKFRECGLLHQGVPRFANGYSLDDHLWLYEQPSAYYRRHLLLHEGTHAFMASTLGDIGPPWYAEGLAEMLGTHAWSEGRLRLGIVPSDKEQVEQWGRVKIVREELAARRGRTLRQIMDYSSRAHLDNEPYGWCWAAASFLDRHPAYREAFRGMQSHVALPKDEFNRKFYSQVARRWPLLQAEWQWYVTQLDYGFDVAREAIETQPSAPLGEAPATVTVDAARGWQSSGLRLEAGKAYRLRAGGRYQVDDDPAPWISEPNGVTLRYHGGRPVGLLLAAVHDETQAVTSLSQLCRPAAVGASRVLRPSVSGTLYLRVNESPSQLDDNRGRLEVSVEAAAAP